jgi:hypothetical protein
VQSQTNPQGVRGRGLTSGTIYRGTGATHSSFNTSGPPPFEESFVNTFNIIGRGPANNLLVHETIHLTVNANGDVTAEVTNTRVTCR